MFLNLHQGRTFFWSCQNFVVILHRQTIRAHYFRAPRIKGNAGVRPQTIRRGKTHIPIAFGNIERDAGFRIACAPLIFHICDFTQSQL